MSKIMIRSFKLILLLFIIVSCQNKEVKNLNQNKPGKNELTELNRYFVQKDRERIQSFIERKNLSMTESPTGLWYSIAEEGKGSFYKDYDHIKMEYECSLLDGTLCYSSKESGPKEIILGKSQLEAGLYEGLRLLKPGGRATFILPPFLGYGLVGDGKKIPSRAIIVYDITIK